jgi:Zn-dependent protease
MALPPRPSIGKIESMLAEPGQTNYDFHFRLFGTPVRVHPLFWLFSAILGWNALDDPDGFVHLLIWIIVSFLSILLHEFGHVWMGAALGSRDSYIVLYSFGGLAVGSRDVPHRWQRIAVSLAGPGIQIALFAILWFGQDSLTLEQLRRIPPRLIFFLDQLLYINLVWPLFNLLPVWPLDGGMVTRDVCTGVSPHGGLRFSLGLSIGVAGFIAVYALLSRAKGMVVIPFLPTSTWSAILFGMLALQSWQLLQQARIWQPPVDDRLPWEDDADAWKR